jgi:hypothetical protein
MHRCLKNQEKHESDMNKVFVSPIHHEQNSLLPSVVASVVMNEYYSISL